MEQLEFDVLKKIYSKEREKTISGKWITYSDISPLIAKFSSFFTVQQIGFSENKVPINKIVLGKGDKRILIWSQMHGNESTGTKAVFDLLNCIAQNKNDQTIQCILENCTIVIIPMLNPDGALLYTRSNYHNIDLNRDAVDLKAEESRVLRTVLDKFNPHYCFNLHDQRTIFGVQNTKNPASISFLAPSEDVEKNITKGRKQTMSIIVEMNNLLQQIIPNHIGRYTDEFYPTATGDNFQKLGHNTILIEAGHYPDDYQREKVREFNFYALIQGIYSIASDDNTSDYMKYFDIPNNEKIFFDVVHYFKEKKPEAYQYEEQILEGVLVRKLKKQVITNPNEVVLGHVEIQF